MPRVPAKQRSGFHPKLFRRFFGAILGCIFSGTLHKKKGRLPDDAVHTPINPVEGLKNAKDPLRNVVGLFILRASQ